MLRDHNILRWFIKLFSFKNQKKAVNFQLKENVKIHIIVYIMGMSAHYHARLFATPWTVLSSLDCSLPGSSVHGIFQTRTLE